jgi:hypothetical protein
VNVAALLLGQRIWRLRRTIDFGRNRRGAARAPMK